jgi:hypothetical protein
MDRVFAGIRAADKRPVVLLEDLFGTLIPEYRQDLTRHYQRVQHTG